MRFVSYQRDGAVYHGRLAGADLASGVIELGPGDLLGVLEGEGLAAAGQRSGAERSADEIMLISPLLRPPKLLAVAANYADHIREGGGTPMNPAAATPRLFLKPSTSITGPYDPIRLPTISSQNDWEVELAVVIGQRCRDVPVEQALDVVAGYVTANDVSARSIDAGFERDSEHVHPFFDWLLGKWPDGFAPLGPYLVTADEVPDPQDLELVLEVDGVVRQQGSTKDMIFGVAELIAFASSVMTLEPGDVIETGTPDGTGAAIGVYLKPGEVMTARVGNLGEQRTPVQSA
ncbi:fumarylacetoacetate hydrolase family protein [Microlunatus speluncae]|uniref:fumarylacetoacetate hydrolase family protein n=1 Tax=Microlunatus speluncae TaxID=2594267 RepID=UPI0012665DA9|nr:fumarylacetoacetate hydrolase family protein [Microlunatus speluncae]